MARVIGQRWEVYDFNVVKECIPRKGEIVVLKNTPDFESSIIQIIASGNRNILELYNSFKDDNTPLVREIAKEVLKIQTGKVDKLSPELTPITTAAAKKITHNAQGQITSTADLAKSDIGLGNVTDDAQVKRSEMGAARGVATLNVDGKVPENQLPEIGGVEYGPFRLYGPFSGNDSLQGILWDGYIDFKQFGNSTLSYQFYLEFAGSDGGGLPVFREEEFYRLALLSGTDANPFWWDGWFGDNPRSLKIVKGSMISPWGGVFYGGISGSCRLISPGPVIFDYGQGGSAASCKLTWHPGSDDGWSWGEHNLRGVRLWVSSPKRREGVRTIVGGGLVVNHSQIFQEEEE